MNLKPNIIYFLSHLSLLAQPKSFLKLFLDSQQFVFAYVCLILVIKVHVLPRGIFGVSTFGISMAFLKWLPLRLVDKFLLLMANFTLGNTEQLGLQRPKTGPIELKNATGKTPVLDLGALSQIKSGKIKVIKQPNQFTFLVNTCYKLTFAIPLANVVKVSGDERCERDNKEWGKIYGWTRGGV